MTWFDSPFWATQNDRWQGYAAQRTRLPRRHSRPGHPRRGGAGRRLSHGFGRPFGELRPGFLDLGNRRLPVETRAIPSASFLDPANSSQAIRDEVFPPSQILYASGDIAGTLLTFEPKKKTVSVRFIDHVTGATRFEQVLQVDGPPL